jgi:hypothetical protein
MGSEMKNVNDAEIRRFFIPDLRKIRRNCSISYRQSMLHFFNLSE